ncbi:hypothetical protein GCM10010470_23760 [Saccharopolyspora taberi]|uniref:Uncharacterized protein n=1 Tax=Saccharopolyspora taberi TaxID=60895 RepID=A0ABN3VEE1_9PSEU
MQDGVPGLEFVVGARRDAPIQAVPDLRKIGGRGVPGREGRDLGFEQQPGGRDLGGAGLQGVRCGA